MTPSALEHKLRGYRQEARKLRNNLDNVSVTNTPKKRKAETTSASKPKKIRGETALKEEKEV